MIVVNWNAGEQLYRCVNSVVKYSSGLDVEIIVVDNG
ncbi:MAG: glycosyltransferase family 2 protein, partial [Campylobacterales bacterium]|nr:glycosyltransferase family 2 protein [Campylobacterales bacterium]